MSEKLRGVKYHNLIWGAKETVRDLGVHISSNRTWAPHIEQTVQGARKMAAWALSAFRDRSQIVVLTLYKSTVRYKLKYCCHVWNPVKITDTEAGGCPKVLYQKYQWLS